MVITDTCDFNDLWLHLNSNSWIQKTAFPGMNRTGLSTFVLGNFAYAGLGFISGQTFNDFYCYNGANHVWVNSISIKNSLPHFHMKLSIGYDENLHYHNDFYTYNANNNVWTQIANYPGPPTSYVFALPLGENAYLGTGRGPGNVFRNNVYEISRTGSEITNYKSDLA